MSNASAWLEARGVSTNVELIQNEYEACRGADALIIATEWNEYRSPQLERLAQLMRGRWIFDGRNVLVPEAVADAGFRYRGMGRPGLGDGTA
jgi:UDPglucose 6-dehydrogenase